MTLIETALLSVLGLIGTGYISAMAYATSRPSWNAPSAGNGRRSTHRPSALASLTAEALVKEAEADSADPRSEPTRPFGALVHDGSPHDAVRAAARSMSRMAADLRDDDLRAALEETACVLEDVADLLLRDPSCARRARDLLDYHLPKSHDVARDLAALSAQPRLSHTEASELAYVSRTVAEMPELFTAHLHSIREDRFLRLAHDHEALRIIAFDLEHPDVRAPSST